ncbi:MAG TPA: NAD(P)/FAD-dependent oxidoreductase [Candidatus Didemnitutus sp.]|nr:NAD(P)/FAD-dependent oxidoreductase [Candidatus Didemnitutus sp.]
MKDSHYDVAIIGAGMSGLAAGIRLAHFGKRVCIFERHNAPGGLNSFYSFDGRKFDVGLHALTNFVPAGIKGTPLGKILRQLRIDRDEFALCPQKRSRVSFPGCTLQFTNDYAVFESEVATRFPGQIDAWRRLVSAIREFNDTALDVTPESARMVVGQYLSDPLLVDMLFCPLMYYGSAQEDDMDFAQFVIMYKALFLEGFSRPLEGVRVIIRVLLEKFRAAGGERRMKCGVRRIGHDGQKVTTLELDTGEVVTATHVLSSAGSAETRRMCGESEQATSGGVGRLSFVETISVFSREPASWGWGDDTIVFFNDSDRFAYHRPDEAVDPRSGVICLPNNFDFGAEHLPEGVFRTTCLANYDRWTALPEDEYRAAKIEWFARVQASARRFLPAVSDEQLKSGLLATDMFTPRTVEKFTGHFGGAIYGAPEKVRDGHTALQNLYLCGTDQGFLGIVGAMLSGISMANYHILQKS